MVQDVTLIGFGEAGMAFATAASWKQRAVAYDIALERQSAAAEAGVVAARSAQKALQNAPVILSLVTADQALTAAREYAPLIAPGALWCDMNSVAPETKRAAAAAIEANAGRYVDVAVLAPVKPAPLSVSLLLAGASAGAAQGALAGLGFTNLRIVGDAVGRASAVKMIRSVMVKGLEALTAEMLLAAAAAGVTDEVLASLDASERSVSWAERADYNLDRMLVHGLRRAAEMSESSDTLRGLGVTPMMTENIVGWQQALGELALSPVPQGLDTKLAAIMQSPAFRGAI